MSHYENENQNQDEGIDLAKSLDKMWRVVKKMWPVFLIILIVSAAVPAVTTKLNFHPTYTSKVTFIVAEEDGDSLFNTGNTAEIMTTAFSELISSSYMQNIVKEELGTDTIPGQISVQAISDTSLVELKATSSKPEDAYAIVECIANNYGQMTQYTMPGLSMLIIQNPEVPEKADYEPDYMQTSSKGLMLGAAIVCGIAVLLTVLQNTIVYENDVKEKLHLKYLTSIPLVKSKRKTQRQVILTNPKVDYRLKEAFYNLRMLIENDAKKAGRKVYMVTSTLANEGKSTIAANAAIALANHGHKVVLVDLDLRNPTAGVLLQNKVEAAKGIGDYLTGKVGYKDIFCEVDGVPKLSVIMGTESYEDALEMLSSVKMISLLQKLKEEFEFVILDVPPLQLMGDSVVVAKYTDSVIAIVKQNYARTYEVLDALDELNDIAPDILGCVLNQAKNSVFASTASDSYYYQYGYGKK